jgi:gentisate 1,2-dioxygenase
VTIGTTTHLVSRYDGWNHPSWRPYVYTNTGSEPFVRLTYTNAPLLEKMNVHLVEDLDEMPLPGSGPVREASEDATGDARRTSPFGTFELAGGAYLMPYETLINPSAVPSDALHWPWTAMKQHLDRLEALGESYIGRRLYLMYNPFTGRGNGTTPSFFATITIRPPGIVDRPHRHVSSAINYFFHGSGWSRVGDRRYEWGPGDLMLTAPGWMIHHHASDDGDRVYELTVQDQPLNLAMESLLWQEDLKRPPRVLGSETGFATNREAQPVG